MATFPALEPATRSYSQGRYPVSLQPLFAADPVRFSHGPRPFGYVLTLGYQYLTAAEAKLIRDHWRTQAGGFEPFMLSPEAMAGHGLYALVPSVKRWRYLAPPQEQHLTGSLVNLTVELETVEGVYVLGASLTITVSIVTGAASAATAALALTITATIEAGAPTADSAAPAADATVTVSLEAGAATGD